MSPEGMSDAVIANLPAKTGKSLDEWIEVIRSQTFENRRAKVEWLKATHGLGHVQADIVVWREERPADYRPKTDEELFDEQYTGGKAHLRPIAERLLAMIQALGPDVWLGYRETYVASARRRQFAVVQPTNCTRIDLGLMLRGVPDVDTLEIAKGVGGGSITHRIPLSHIDDITADTETWLRKAYDATT